MKQITIVHQNNALYVAGVKDNGEIIEPELTESLRTHIQAIADELDSIKDPEEQLKDKMVEFIEKTADDDTALAFIDLWPEWSTLIGREGKVGTLLQKDGHLYRIIQGLPEIFEHQPPELLPAHYSIINPPDEPNTPIEWTPGTYAKGAIVTHNGKTWESGVDFNHWEPGSAGVYESIWKDITE